MRRQNKQDTVKSYCNCCAAGLDARNWTRAGHSLNSDWYSEKEEVMNLYTTMNNQWYC